MVPPAIEARALPGPPSREGRCELGVPAGSAEIHPKVSCRSPASLADDFNTPEGEVRRGAAPPSPAAFRTPCAATLSVALLRLARLVRRRAALRLALLVQVHTREAALRVGLPRQGVLRACLPCPVHVHAREALLRVRLFDQEILRARLLFGIPGLRALGLRASPLPRQLAPPASTPPLVCVGIRVVASVRSVPSPAGRVVVALTSASGGAIPPPARSSLSVAL